MALRPLEVLVPVLGAATPPVLQPVPWGAVRVLPRWSGEDEVIRWRLRYREQEPGGLDLTGAKFSGGEEGWVELELRHFTRELPLTGLRPGRLHFFTVSLETPEGWSAWSPVVSCEPPAPSPPGKCAAVLAIVKDATTALLRWTRPIDFAASGVGCELRRYRVLATWTATGSQETEPLLENRKELVVEGDADSCEVPDLFCLRDYRFQVAAENVAGWGVYSDLSPVLLMPPPVPATLPQPTLRRATHHSATIQWQHPPLTDLPVESFRFRYTISDDWTRDVQEHHDVPANLSQYIVEGLKPGQVYSFQVRALNKYGKGIWSDSSIPIRTLDGKEPSKVMGLSVPHVYKSFITLQWPPAEENGFEVTGHLARYSFNADMSDPQEVVPAVVRKSGMDTCDMRHLKKMKYYFQVAAINKIGMSAWSDPLCVNMALDAPRVEAG